jgi:acetyl esterase/lipase
VPPPLPPPAHEQPLPAAVGGPAGTRRLLGVPYAAIQAILTSDLFPDLRSGDGPHPVVLFLHGGGWRLGSRHLAGPAYRGQTPTPFERVAQAGIAVASVDYRLSGEAVFPAQLHDAKAAVRWLRARAGELGVDPDRIAAWGESAGAHLAALLGLVGDQAMEGDVGLAGTSSAVSAVVAWYAPTDLAAVAADLGVDPHDPATREAQLLGAPAVDVPELAAQASPVTHVSPEAPPFLLLHGAADRMIPCVQSERLYHARVEAGVEAELDIYEDADHMWLGSSEAPEQALDRTVDVLRRRFGLKRGSA